MPYKDVTKRRQFAREWVAQRRAKFFSDKVCKRCGSNTDLELDHIDPSKKESHSIWSWSVRRQEKEIAKCQVLCRTCHRKKTRQDRKVMAQNAPLNHGTRGSYERGCRCVWCVVEMKHIRMSWHIGKGKPARNEKGKFVSVHGV